MSDPQIVRTAHGERLLQGQGSPGVHLQLGREADSVGELPETPVLLYVFEALELDAEDGWEDLR
jgi:hypothetical protein